MPGGKGPNAYACAQHTEADENDFSIYFHALRRRWKVILGWGLMLAVAAGALLKISQSPYYSADTLLRISPNIRPLAFETRAANSESQIESLRITYKQLVKSRPVLAAALEQPSISALPDVKNSSDPIEWLDSKIKILFVERSSEIMQVSVQDGDPERACWLADGVADAFLDWCAATERKQRRKQIEELQRAYDDKQAELARQQAQCAQLVEASGGMDSLTLDRRRQIVVQLLTESQKELTRLKFELQRAESERQIRQSMRIDPSNPVAADEKLAGLGRDDPLANKLLVDLEEMERYAAKFKAVVAPEAAGRFESYGQMAELAAARERYLSRLLELRRHKEDALDADIERLRSQIAVIEGQSSQTERKIEDQNTDAEKMRTSLVDVEILKGNIRRTEEVLDQLALKIKEVEVDLGSISPVSLVQRAEVPKAPANRKILYATCCGCVFLCFLLTGAAPFIGTSAGGW